MLSNYQIRHYITYTKDESERVRTIRHKKEMHDIKLVKDTQIRIFSFCL
jgi:hypothetical protein